MCHQQVAVTVVEDLLLLEIASLDTNLILYLVAAA